MIGSRWVANKQGSIGPGSGKGHSRLTVHSSRRRFAARLNSRVRHRERCHLTKDQFVRARAEFYRKDRRFNAVYLSLFFVLIIGAVPLSSFVPEHYQAAVGICYVLALLANAGIYTLRIRKQAERAGLVCRTCGGRLLGAPGDIAVATGNCPHCGQASFRQ